MRSAASRPGPSWRGSRSACRPPCGTRPAAPPPRPTRRSRPAASACGRCSCSWPRRPPGAGARPWSRPPRPSSSCTWRRSCTTTCSMPRPCAAAGAPCGRRTARAWRAPRATTSTRAPSRCSPRPATREAVRTLAEAALDLARGEALQVEQSRRPETSAAAYLERCRLKTGRLFAAACRLGGQLGGLEPADARRARALRGRPGARLPARRRRARLRRRPAAHGQGARHRPARRHRHAAAAARRRARPRRGGRAARRRRRPRGRRAAAARARRRERRDRRDERARARLRAGRRGDLAGLSGRCDVDALGAILRRAVERSA